MANPYPAELLTSDGGTVRINGEITFTDPGNQPGGGSITVLGPYVFNYNDSPDVNVQPFKIPGLPDNLLADHVFIIDTLVEIPLAWSQDLDYRLGVIPADSPTSIEYVNRMDVWTSGSTNIMDDAIGIENSVVNAVPQKRAFRLDKAGWAAEISQPVTNVTLALELYSPGPAFTTGQLRVTALTYPS